MNSIILLLKEYKQALLFLLKFIGLYFLLNTVYGLYVEYYKPDADPITILVSQQARWVLSWFHEGLIVVVTPQNHYIAILKGGETVINIFEGCNGVNVLIVYFVFTVSFSSHWIKYWKFLFASVIIIYGVNLARVIVLFWVAFYFPSSLYFFHKFLFTGIIYGFVFLLWYVWVKKTIIALNVEPRNNAS
jgi:exosortase family protein XrtF